MPVCKVLLGIKPGSPALQADSLPSELPGKPCFRRCFLWGRECWLDGDQGSECTGEVAAASALQQGGLGSSSLTN